MVPMNRVAAALVSTSAAISPCALPASMRRAHPFRVTLDQGLGHALGRLVLGALQLAEHHARHARMFDDEFNVAHEHRPSAASGDSAPCAARSIRASSRSATHSMTACQIASLVGK